jgi:tryptophan synthase alpha chain
VSRIAARFDRLRSQGRKAFVPYITAGSPNIEFTIELARMLERSGADILELGLPHTDPIADGPTNQRAAQQALEAGMTPQHLLDAVGELRNSGFELPIVLFTYFNPLRSLLARPEGTAALAGIDGILVTDLPPEEARDHIASCRAADIDTIFLAAPTTPTERIPRIAEAGRGFLYYVSSKGVTGARDGLPQDLEAQVARLRAATDLPVCVGFGIANRSTAARVCAVADGYVVGSALGKVIEGALAEGSDALLAAERFVGGLDPR